jgi:hypothetical protein
MNQILKIIFLVYFISHIPITLCLDCQVVFGSLYPEVLTTVYSWYCQHYSDLLMLRQPVWLKSFVFCEFLFQLPFFFVAVYGLLYEKEWIRTPSIIYGAHVSTTVIPILSEIVFSREILLIEKCTLLSFYTPYLLIPMTLLLYMVFNENPFKSSKLVAKVD